MSRRRWISRASLLGASSLPGPASLLGASTSLRGTASLLSTSSLLGASSPQPLPARRGRTYVDAGVSEEWVATSYNNFYEFHPTDKEAVRHRVGKFQIHPWTIEVTGLVSKPKTYDIDDLRRRMPLEERLYRFRCVEAWAMAVPWIGFPMSALLKEVEPLASAKFVRFVSVMRRAEQPGIGEAPWYPWPYFEALRLDEAMNELAMFVVGMYGKTLPKQNGAPLRAIVPWKYGYKNPKSIVRIELVAERPATFWNQHVPGEYGFYSNVNPAVPHPRWSQAVEKVIPAMERQRTLPYNGYGQWVASMYTGKEF